MQQSTTQDRVLVIGGGGREHALAWKLAQSDRVATVYIVPGNAGTASLDKVENVECEASVDGWLELARSLKVDLVVIGPEMPLVMGLADVLRESNIPVFGPGQLAARLEGSKAYAKEFMQQHDIPTAQYKVFDDKAAALDWLHLQHGRWVVKADGLAAGKGVILCENIEEAKVAVEEIFAGKFGVAGARVIIEQFLTGEEASYICIISGGEIVPMASSQDHKARDNGDVGPNTGGMGAYSPAPLVDEEMERKILDLVIKPVIEGLEKEGVHYTGFLYAGIMVGDDGLPKVLEFNCRFGDPETQPIMMRLQGDLYEVLLRAATGESIKDAALSWDNRAALGVVMAAGGYPEHYTSGDEVRGLDGEFASDVMVFHAGTATESSNVVTAGGRVLCVTALGKDVADAQQKAYKAVEKIHWDGAYFRTDIGHRAINR